MVLSSWFLFVSAICLSYGRNLQNVPQPKSLESMESVLESSHTELFENYKTNEQPKLYWKRVTSTAELPENAIVGGKDVECGTLYVARAWHDRYLVPGKFCQRDGTTHITYKGSEVKVQYSEVLCGNEVFWYPTTGGRLPAEAIPVGNMTTGETLYAGRGFVYGYLTPGMVQPSTNAIIIPYGGHLFTHKNYEILVWSPRAYRWETVLYPSSEIPEDAVVGGYDTVNNCGKLYVARAWHQGELIPAKLCGNNRYAYIAYHGQEVNKTESEVLCSNHVLWEKAKNGEIPSNALKVGFTAEGEKLLAGRGYLGTTLIPGKVQSSDNLLYTTYDNRQYATSDYEILILV